MSHIDAEGRRRSDRQSGENHNFLQHHHQHRIHQCYQTNSTPLTTSIHPIQHLPTLTYHIPQQTKQFHQVTTYSIKNPLQLPTYLNCKIKPVPIFRIIHCTTTNQFRGTLYHQIFNKFHHSLPTFHKFTIRMFHNIPNHSRSHKHHIILYHSIFNIHTIINISIFHTIKQPIHIPFQPPE
jgi:hypothetical protein